MSGNRPMKTLITVILLTVMSIPQLYAAGIRGPGFELNGKEGVPPPDGKRSRRVPEIKDRISLRPIFIRIFKLPGVLEIWERTDEVYVLSRTYPICSFSGFLGPKRREGDRQSPEGFYSISARKLNPASKYHLSFDIGYPNLYDTARGYTGSSIMVHGGCTSSGCFAMTDKGMEEIYGAVKKAFQGGQTTIPIHIFPFALTPENLDTFAASPWIEFWKSMAPLYHHFERTGQVPTVFLDNNGYTWQPVGVPVAFHP